MLKKTKKLVTANIGAKAIALLLALIVWVLVNGNQKAYTEQALSVLVDVTNLPQNIDASNINPPTVRVTVRGPSAQFQDFKPDKVRITIDLKDATHGGKLSFYAEDLLQLPDGIDVVSLHPKRIEVFLEELASREVAVQPSLAGHLPEGLKLKAVRCNPERVTIFGEKNLINQINQVFTEEIDLGKITSSATLKKPLKQPGNVSKFLDRKEAEVRLEIEGKGPVEK